ncbi:MAG: DUF262 domain-containing protein [Fibrobacterales bacterium]|nr:DUF262 domain-containing protein [Fibrobacterales bacterium]
MAIARIGDLLLENKITEIVGGKEQEDLGKIELRIPDYQRPYKWTTKNATQLFNDIVEAKEANKEVYRVGTLILHSHDGVYDIVDGQQRAITFSLLLNALDSDAVSQLLNQKLVDNPKDNSHNVPANYRSFKRKAEMMAAKAGSEKADFCDYVKNNCEMIVIITDDQTEAFQFFDSQNSRGKELYPHDLLKAYHLREMSDVPVDVTEKVVDQWEGMDQQKLSSLFGNYLYRLKEWIGGNIATKLTSKNVDIFKGITKNDNFPYARFFKGAYSYATMVNSSSMPFVAGMRDLNPFQIDAPIIAGKSFFDYSKHYYDILEDIRNNDKYSGYYINDNEIVKTIDAYSEGVGNCAVRLLFDVAILLYIDRFCPERPSKSDTEMLENFVVLAFVWAYSLRAQYAKLSWWSVQQYVLGDKRNKNSFNMYKFIAGADSPAFLFSMLEDEIVPIGKSDIYFRNNAKKDGENEQYIAHFKSNGFWKEEKK